MWRSSEAVQQLDSEISRLIKERLDLPGLTAGGRGGRSLGFHSGLMNGLSLQDLEMGSTESLPTGFTNRPVLASAEAANVRCAPT